MLLFCDCDSDTKVISDTPSASFADSAGCVFSVEDEFPCVAGSVNTKGGAMAVVFSPN